MIWISNLPIQTPSAINQNREANPVDGPLELILCFPTAKSVPKSNIQKIGISKNRVDHSQTSSIIYGVFIPSFRQRDTRPIVTR